MDVVLDASVQREADPEGFTPTASSAVAMAVGHALAIALMQARGFTAEHFSRLHAGGQLGRNLRLRVGDAMHRGDEVAWVAPEDSLKHVVIAMSQRPLGAACVVSPDGTLTGLITDGDVRRALQAHDDIRTLRACDVMTPRPSTLRKPCCMRRWRSWRIALRRSRWCRWWTPSIAASACCACTIFIRAGNEAVMNRCGATATAVLCSLPEPSRV